MNKVFNEEVINQTGSGSPSSGIIDTSFMRKLVVEVAINSFSPGDTASIVVKGSNDAAGFQVPLPIRVIGETIDANANGYEANLKYPPWSAMYGFLVLDDLPQFVEVFAALSFSGGTNTKVRVYGFCD